jgi:hypothetical protein
LAAVKNAKKCHPVTRLTSSFNTIFSELVLYTQYIERHNSLVEPYSKENLGEQLTSLKGSSPISFCPKKTIRATQKKRMS